MGGAFCSQSRPAPVRGAGGGSRQRALPSYCRLLSKTVSFVSFSGDGAGGQREGGKGQGELLLFYFGVSFGIFFFPAVTVFER